MIKRYGLPLHHLAWAVALLPILTVHISYLLAASYGQVEWCVPYWDSCTSISATGRQMPAKFVFKMGMIPAALLTVVFWWGLWRWCQFVLAQKDTLVMPILGSLAAVFLIQYTLALGEVGDGYRFLRRTGVVLTFALTFIAQVLFVRRLKSLSQKVLEYRVWYLRMIRLLLLLLAIGMTSVMLDAVLGDAYDKIEDAFEWWMALFLNGFFILVAVMLRRQFKLSVGA